MIANALTLAGFIGLASLGIAAIGLVVAQMGRNAEIRERVAKLEARLGDHLRNGFRHERED